MIASWTKGLEDDAAEEMESHFKRSKILRNRLIFILENKVEVAQRDLINTDNFILPQWELKQAERIGYINSMKQLINLIKDKD